MQKMWLQNSIIFDVINVIYNVVCQNVNNEFQCMCKEGFTWNSAFCSKYQPCSGNFTSGQTCDCIRSEPTEGTFCEPTAIMTTTTPSIMSTSTPRSTIPTTVSATTMTPQDNLVHQNHAIRDGELAFVEELNNRSSSLFKNHSKRFKELLENAYRIVDRDAVVNILGFTTQEGPFNQAGDDKIPCIDEKYGITNYNTSAKLQCENMMGTKTSRCGKNGLYEQELNFCVSEEIYRICEELKTNDLEKTFPSTLQQLSCATRGDNITSPGNVKAVVDILSNISTVNSTVNETDMKNFLQTVSRMISSSSKDTWEILSDSSENIRNPSFRLLKSVENFNTRFNMQNNSLDIKEENLMFKARRNVHQDNKTSINLNFDNISTAEYDNLSATLFISPEKPNEAPNVTVISIAYPTWIDILPSTTTFDGNFLINSLVLTVVINIKEPINVKMTFSLRNRTLDFNTAVCGFWDFTGRGAWNDTGCEPEINEENITCHCDHLTSFSILMSPETKDSPALNYITSIGVAISIGSLLITIIIEAIMWKHVTKHKISYIRHVGILNIAVNLLVADVWFIVASAVEPGTRACTAATFFTHFFYLALFFWMLTLGLLLVYRLLFPFHDLSRSVMMGISFAVGYLPPLIISIITIGVTFPRNSHTREGACWLGWETEYPLLAFVIPALVIIAINVIILIIVIFKLLRPTIGDGSRANNQEREAFKLIARCIAVLTPILGLTWAFGIPTFQQGSPVAFHYIFTILNAFQGLFILVFAVLLDNKIRHSLMKKSMLSQSSSKAQSTSTANSPPKSYHWFHSRKKSYNLTHESRSSNKNPSLLFYSELTTGAQ
ncbi:adhesion G-protein coupled receptor F2-like [Chiloscyllium plagiosum]|uniref:adhesion G-protein coupled receptor F2-like n=1 Tax=Chiloscyllium plagiosum TaxID=36176 RepID=UPI001CB7B985|nr:adhesion G-protein coupled receptor F2-like [Chiloscyllium plagiosum]